MLPSNGYPRSPTTGHASPAGTTVRPQGVVQVFPGFVPTAAVMGSAKAQCPPGSAVMSSGRLVQVMPKPSGGPGSPRPAGAVAAPGAVLLPLPLQQHSRAQYKSPSSPSASHSPGATSSPQGSSASALAVHSQQPQQQQHSPKQPIPVPSPKATTAQPVPSPKATTAQQQLRLPESARIFHHARSRSEGWRQHHIIAGATNGQLRAQAAHHPAVTDPKAAVAAVSAGKESPGKQERPEGLKEQGSGQATIAGRAFKLDGILGKGSFGTVYRAYEDGGAGDGKPLKAAVKEIRCRSEKECKQAEYEAMLMKRLSSDRVGVGRRRSESKEYDTDGNPPCDRVVCCPALLAHQTVATAHNQWTVMIAMERVPGIPLDDFTKELTNRLPYREGVKLCRELLQQLCPTLERVAPHCVHRDINAHNILLDMPSSSSSSPPRRPRFTLIDFGLATETSGWRAGDWKTKDIGGDCRYWPVSCWKLFLFGFKYLLADSQLTNEYIHSLDVHSLVLTSIQLLVEVTKGKQAEGGHVLEKAWTAYWGDAMHFWKQLYHCFKNGGDWNALKSAFLKQQVAETTGRNLESLRSAVTACAAMEEEASTAALFRTLSRMLDGEVVEWADLAKLLNSTEQAAQAPAKTEQPSKPAAPPRKFVHHRTRTIDQAMTRDVPDLAAARFCAEALDASPSPDRLHRGSPQGGGATGALLGMATSPQRGTQHAAGAACGTPPPPVTAASKLDGSPPGASSLSASMRTTHSYTGGVHGRVLRKVTEEFRTNED